MQCRENYGHCWEDCSTPTETGRENVLPAVSCDVEDRQPREWESKSHKSFIKVQLRGWTLQSIELPTNSGIETAGS